MLYSFAPPLVLSAADLVQARRARSSYRFRILRLPVLAPIARAFRSSLNTLTMPRPRLDMGRATLAPSPTLYRHAVPEPGAPKAEAKMRAKSRELGATGIADTPANAPGITPKAPKVEATSFGRLASFVRALIWAPIYRDKGGRVMRGGVYRKPEDLDL